MIDARAQPRVRLRAVVLVVLLVAPWRLSAQSGSAAIAGSVRDSTGAPLVGVTVTAEDSATGIRRAAVTGSSGGFEIGGFPPATRVIVSVLVEGFRPVEHRLEPLASGDRRLLDLRLEPAGLEQTVVVTVDHPLGRASTPELGGSIGREQIDRLPVNGRDLLALAYLVPGAAPARGFFNLAPKLTINGASSLSTNYSIDGFDNTDLFLGGPKLPVSLAASDSVKVMVNAYSAEYGRTGNGVFLVTTRSGANSHRGDVVYVVRPGAALDSPNFFAPVDDAGAAIDDSFVRHQVGATAGGPLASGRFFYFADTELTRERQDAILISPLAAGLAPTRFDNRLGLGKIDARWNNGQTTTFRYQASDSIHDRDVGFIGGLTLPSAGLKVHNRNYFVSALHRGAAASVVYEAGAQIGRLRANWQPLDEGPRVIVTDRGAAVAVLGGVSDPFFWTETDVQIRGVSTWTAGPHTLKAGGDVLRGSFLIDSGPGARGAYVVDLQGRDVVPAGRFVERADLPRDVTVLSYSQSFVNPEVRGPQWLASTFVEDILRPARDLTVTLGVRWDYDSVTNTPVGSGDWNNVAPRAGVTWAPGGSPRHLWRGGYGVFYERIPFAVHSDTLFNDPVRGAISMTFTPGTPFEPPPFPQTFARDAFTRTSLGGQPPRNVQVFDPALRSPSTAQASAGYVFAVTEDFAVSADYVHSRGRNLIRRIDINAPAPFDGPGERSVTAADATRPMPPASGGLRLIEQDQSSGHSRFNGLYLSARKRLSQGHSFDVSYTLSRVENDTDDINFRPVDSRRADAELGPSLNDRRHVLAVNALARLPLGIDVVPVVFLSSGQPLNVTTGRDDNGDTVFNDRPPGVARNSERTSGFAQVDLGVARRVKLRAMELEARVEIFNAFNRTNFSGFFNWGASGVRPDEQGTLEFQPTQAGPARQVQLSARLIF